MAERLTEATPQGRGRGMIRRFRRSQDGSAAVEFAFIIIPFTMLAWAGVETGLMLWTNQVLDESLSQASRLLLTGESRSRYASKDPVANTAAFRDAVCGLAPLKWVQCDKLAVDVRTYTSFSDAGSETAQRNPLASGNLDTRDFAYRQPAADQIVIVRAALEYKLFLTGWASTNLANIGGQGSGRRGIVATVALKTEPFDQ